ncbi:hypothetical protein ABW21_db0201122 [Orbilia brochopaga]|nr:hypothetical protein ABW21_db0201122 [Drechslerella brochopaga]
MSSVDSYLSDAPTPRGSESDSPGNPNSSSASSKARPITACLTCRNRKVKCDKVYPLCGPCSKSGRECKYDRSAPGAVAAHAQVSGAGAGNSNASSAANSITSSHPVPRSVSGGGGVTKHGHAHIVHGTSPVAASGKGHNHVHGHGHGGGKTKIDLQQRITRLESLLADSMEQIKSGSAAANPPTGPTASSGQNAPSGQLQAPYHRPSIQDVLPVADFQLKVRDGGQKTRYIGPLSWISAVEDEITDIKQAVLAENVPQDPANPAQGTAWASSMMFPSALGLLNTNSITAYLPTKSHSDFLWQTFVDRVHPLVHILHRPSFQITYDTFWMGQMPAENVKSFLALLFAIYYASVASMDPPMALQMCGLERTEQLRIYKDATQHALVNARFMESEELASLQALTLLISMLLQGSGQSQCNATWTWIAVAFRIARSMGLHRDPSCFPSIGEVEGEVRRRLWYYIFQLELYAIGPATAIPAINEDSFDTRLPRDANDDRIIDGRPLPNDDTRGYTEMSHFLFRCHAGRYYLSSLKVTSSLRKVKKEEFHSLIREMQEWGRRLETDWLPHFSSWEAKSRLCKKTAILLIHKAILVLYYPVSKPKHRNLLPANIRENAIQAACAVVEMSNSMETDPGVGPYVWFYSSYTQYHAAAILLGELIANPETKYKEQMWRCIDEMFALSSSPELAWVKGTAHSTDWKLCRGLYEKACATRTWRNTPTTITMTSSEGHSIPLPTAGRQSNMQEGWTPDIDWSTWDQMMTHALYDENLFGNPGFQEIGNAYLESGGNPSSLSSF